jgi:predicted Rossmann fold nucleotide-binding protein DprA/Smf involved in DNA uptake
MARRRTSRKKTSSQMVSDQALTKARDTQSVNTTAEQDTSSLPVRPGGKLGRIVDRLGAATGVTADELAEATGWQKHSVLGALSRLRARGFTVRLDEVYGRKAYRIERPED